MKKILSALTAVAVLTVAASAMATIINSKHDFSSANSNPNGAAWIKSTSAGTDQVCVFCHTPHNAVINRALWNRNAATGSYALYTSGANTSKDSWYMSGSKSATLPLGSPSIMCMSCHDGSTGVGGGVNRPPIDAATDAHLASIPMAPTDTIPSSSTANLGPDLTNDHPVSFKYDIVQGEMPTKLFPSADGISIEVTQNPNADVQVLADGTTALPLPGGAIECTTCHAVHDATVVPFLRMSNGHSSLCLACHNK